MASDTVTLNKRGIGPCVACHAQRLILGDETGGICARCWPRIPVWTTLTDTERWRIAATFVGMANALQEARIRDTTRRTLWRPANRADRRRGNGR